MSTPPPYRSVSGVQPTHEMTTEPDLFGPLGLDLDGACPSCNAPLDGDRRGGYCEECE